MGRTTTPAYCLQLIIFLYFLLYTAAASHGAEHLHKPGCSKRERDALLSVKRRITDPANVLLSSWHEDDDCCSWRGVGCDARTGHVVRLDLGPSVYPGDGLLLLLGGDIDPSLARLTHLTHLDLSFSYFNLEPFFPSIGSLTGLVYLNLSHIFNSTGKLHPQLGNLSSLRYLDLNSFDDLEINNLQWLSGLSSLQLLDLSSITLDKVADWLTSINMVPTLAVLHLRKCYLPSIPTSISHNNLTSLAILDLTDNGFYSPLPDWLFNMTSLEFLDLHSNSFHGRIPASLGNICNLRQLDLSVNNVTGGIDEVLEVWSRCRTIRLAELNLGYNNLTGGLPPRIEKLTRLGKFSLAHNHMSGTVPEEIGQLSRLESMDLFFKAFNGVVSEGHFAFNGVESINVCSAYNLGRSRLPSRAPVPADGKGGTEDDAFEMLWFYLGAALGWPAGFWVVFDILIVKENWRIAYFRCVDQVYDKFYVAAALMFIRLRRKMS